MTLGPRTLAAIAEGMQKEDVVYGSFTRVVNPNASWEKFARRVALIAQEEERERCAKLCKAIAGECIAVGLINAAKGARDCAAAIREGR